MILSAFDSTRETIRNSQDKGGRACVQHKHALAVYGEERLQIFGLGQYFAPHSTRAAVRRGVTPKNAREERNESVNVCAKREGS